MQDKYVLVIGSSTYYCRPFHKFGKATNDQGLFKHPGRVALVVFTGGSDISPSLYGHKPSRLTTCTPRRDVYEMLAFRRAQKSNLPIVGICRGAQLLCAMAGGTLYQHVSGHTWDHSIRTWDGRMLHVTSTHHQMQNPPAHAKILAWASPRRSNVYLGNGDEKLAPPDVECECAHYPNINALGIQYHPEMMTNHSPGMHFAAELVDRFLDRKIISLFDSDCENNFQCSHENVAASS